MWYRARLVVAATVTLLLLVACGDDEFRQGVSHSKVSTPPSPAMATEEETSVVDNPDPLSPDSDDTATATVTEAALELIPDDDLAISVFMTFADFGDVAHLSWSSTAIVRGTVIEELVPQHVIFDDPNRDPQIPISDPSEIYTEYVVRIDDIYRGMVADTLKIRRQGGTIDNVTVINESEAELRVGLEAVFFLIPMPEPYAGDFLVLAGGPQGVWWVQGEEVVPAGSEGQAESMLLSELEMAIADALRQPPPDDLTTADGTILYVPLAVAQLGPDLPE